MMILTQAKMNEILSGKDTEIADLTAQLSSANTRLEELKGANERISELETQAETASASIADLTAQLSTAKSESEAKDKAIEDAKASAKAEAVAIAAAAGIEKPLEVTGEAPTVDHIAHMNTLSPAEKTAYFRANLKAIEAQVKANKQSPQTT